MSNSGYSPADIMSLCDWEGGVIDVIDYGINPKELSDDYPEFKEVYTQLYNMYEKMYPLIQEFYKLGEKYGE